VIHRRTLHAAYFEYEDIPTERPEAKRVASTLGLWWKERREGDIEGIEIQGPTAPIATFRAAMGVPEP